MAVTITQQKCEIVEDNSNLAHEDIGVLDTVSVWTLIYYGMLIGFALLGWFAPANNSLENEEL